MLLIFKVTVAVAGTPGPMLGDGVKSTVTVLIPTTAGNSLSNPTDSLGGYKSAMNQAAAAGRAFLQVDRVTIYAITGNTGRVFWGGAGQAAAAMIAQDAATAFPAIGNGDMSCAIDLGQLDVDVTTNGDGFLVVAEM